MNFVAKDALLLQMNLEERKDLLMTLADDPLSVNGPETYDAFKGVSVMVNFHTMVWDFYYQLRFFNPQPPADFNEN